MVPSISASGRLTGSVLIERYDYEPGPATALDRHTHDQYQLCYNPDYVGQVWIGGEWHTVPRGEVALVPPGETHAVRDVDDRSTPGTYEAMSSHLNRHFRRVVGVAPGRYQTKSA